MIRTKFTSLGKKAVTDDMTLKVSTEAKICLECTAKKCRGNCERLRTERKKLKESL